MRRRYCKKCTLFQELYIFQWVYVNKGACPWEQFNSLVDAIDQLSTPLLSQKSYFLTTKIYPWQLCGRFLKSLETAATLYRLIIHFFLFFVRIDRMEKIFRLSCRRAESVVYDFLRLQKVTLSRGCGCSSVVLDMSVGDRVLRPRFFLILETTHRQSA